MGLGMGAQDWVLLQSHAVQGSALCCQSTLIAWPLPLPCASGPSPAARTLKRSEPSVARQQPRVQAWKESPGQELRQGSETRAGSAQVCEEGAGAAALAGIAAPSRAGVAEGWGEGAGQ